MSEEKIDWFDYVKEMNKNGVNEEDAKKLIDETKQKLYVLPFTIDNKGTNIVSHINGLITFVDSRYPGKVNAGEVWICTAEPSYTVYYAMPLFKITPALLMNVDVNLRNEIINILWNRNRKLFENEFAEKYKDEIHGNAVNEVRADLDEIIKSQAAKIEELEEKLKQSMLLISSGDIKSNSEPDTIELGSEMIDDTIDLGSDLPPANDVCTSQVRESIPCIPAAVNRSAPGIPEIRVPELRNNSQRPTIYNVQRTGEDTLYSESFTDLKYFVHISPNSKMLVIRPNDFGSALCINKKIRLKGLGKLVPFTEPKKLMAEYSNVYEGMIVYL